MPVRFSAAWNWNASFLGPYESLRRYPAQSDLLIRVPGGTSDQSLVYAELVNRAQNSLAVVEQQVQYTPLTANPTGSFMAQLADFRQFGSGYRPDYELPWRVGIKFTVIDTIAVPFFGNRAFSSGYGIMTAAVAFKPTGQGNQYYPCATGFNVTGDNSGVLSVIRLDQPWQVYDALQCCVWIVRP